MLKDHCSSVHADSGWQRRRSQSAGVLKLDEVCAKALPITVPIEGVLDLVTNAYIVHHRLRAFLRAITKFAASRTDILVLSLFSSDRMWMSSSGALATGEPGR